MFRLIPAGRVRLGTGQPSPPSEHQKPRLRSMTPTGPMESRKPESTQVNSQATPQEVW